MRKNKKFNIAFIGAGKTMHDHLLVLSSIKEFNLVALHSRSIDKVRIIQKKYKTIKFYEDIGEMYKHENIDMVFVVVSLESILEVALKVLDFKWNIFFEKPLGINYDEFKKIKKKCKKNKSKVFVGLNRRNYSSTLNLIKLLKSTTGKRLIQINDQEDTNSLNKINFNSKVRNNWMYCNSIHLIDYCNFATRGRLVSCKKFSQQQNKAENIISILEFSSGDIAIYKVVWNKPGPWSVAINTKEKYFVKRPIEELRYLAHGTKKFIKIKKDTNDEKFKPGFYNQAKEIMNFLKGLRHNLVDLPEYETTLKMIKYIYGK